MLSRILFVFILIGALLAPPLLAQDRQPTEPEMSPQEAEQLMRSIGDRMRELEQMLAKASLEPDDLAAVIEQLKHAANEKDFERLPRTLREFLLNNPDLLAKLKNPEAEGDELLQTEDEIRRLLATEENAIEKLLKENPDMLERMLEKQEMMQEALQQHNSMENDLDRLFRQTSEGMKSTEQDIEKLMDLAQQMQQQMNQQAQQQRDQLQQEQDHQRQQKERETENGSVEGPDGKDDVNPSSKPGAPDSVHGDLGKVDPEAWDMILPRTMRERGTHPGSNPAPRGWSAEAAEYFRKLAQQARRERERQNRNEEGR